MHEIGNCTGSGLFVMVQIRFSSKRPFMSGKADKYRSLVSSGSSVMVVSRKKKTGPASAGRVGMSTAGGAASLVSEPSPSTSAGGGVNGSGIGVCTALPSPRKENWTVTGKGELFEMCSGVSWSLCGGGDTPSSLGTGLGRLARSGPNSKHWRCTTYAFLTLS